MKLKRVTIVGFRGIPGTMELALDGKSVCLLGENGRGKTTIVDALEYWSTGNLANFHGEGYRLDAAINLRHGAPASVTCAREGQGQVTLTRELKRGRSEALVPVGPASVGAASLPPVPILRHSTMREFMSHTAGQKKRALLDVLGLTTLLEFRDILTTARNDADNEATAAARRLGEEQTGLQRECGGVALLEYAEKLRSEAGLGQPLTSEASLLALDLGATGTIEGRPDLVSLVEQVSRVRDELDLESVDRWNSAVAQTGAVEADALATLLSAGESALEIWPDPTCPLCLLPTDVGELAKSLATRSAALVEVKGTLDEARRRLGEESEAVGRLRGAIRALLAQPPKAGWPRADEIKSGADGAGVYRSALGTAISERRPCMSGPPNLADDLLAELRSAALADAETPASRAVASLGRLRLILERIADCRRKAEVARTVAASIQRIHQSAEGQVRSAVEAAIDRLGETAAEFYRRLVLNPVYSGVKLEYTEGRRGGVEFTMTYDGRTGITPPQRVVSESQLNALGLALFLARQKVETTPWRAMVLDDVVNSFDADHRVGLARLLADEFADWQILLFTHDSMFATYTERFFVGWRFWQIVGWTPQEGPVLSEGDPLMRLESRLNAGETALDLGGLARFALERGLSRPLERLALPIRFDRRGLHSAPEYLDALVDGLAERGSDISTAAVFARMRGQGYLVNVGAHDRQTDPMLSTEDLRQMVADLHELTSSFTCTNCGRPAWETRRGHHSFQCACSHLAV